MSKGRPRRLAGGLRRAAPHSARWWMLPGVAVVILGFVHLRVWPRRPSVEPPARPAEPLASTRWGSIDLLFLREAGSARWHWSPVPVWTTLTLPPGVQLAAPPPLVARSPTVVLAPPRTTDARVDVQPAHGAS